MTELDWTAERLGDWLCGLPTNAVVQADWDDLDQPKKFVPREPHWRDVDGPKKFILQENGLWRDLDGHEWNAYGLAAQAVEMEWDCRWSVVSVPVDAMLDLPDYAAEFMREGCCPIERDAIVQISEILFRWAVAHVTGETP